jgi:glycosyltransferase involved in cell wall biosynthesis
MEELFWLCIFGSIYSYLIYPIVLLAFGLLRVRRRVARLPSYRPPVAVIIAAYNEEARIRAKILNLLQLEYPGSAMRLVVVSDGSDDRTESIVREFADRGVELMCTGRRVGKEEAQRQAIAATLESILVFSDAATLLEPDAIEKFVESFADPMVGGVSSVDRLITPRGEVAGEGLYVRYEMWLRRLESAHNGLIGLSGSCFAARREVCHPLDTRLPSDFGVAINCAMKGMRAISNPAVVGTYKDTSEGHEYRRKVRTILRGMNAIRACPSSVNPMKVGFFAFQVFSHKIMRWAVPWFMALAFILNIGLLSAGVLYQLTFAAQLLVLAASGFGLWTRTKRFAVVRLTHYFLLVQLSAAAAAMTALRGGSIVMWQPTKR